MKITASSANVRGGIARQRCCHQARHNRRGRQGKNPPKAGEPRPQEAVKNQAMATVRAAELDLTHIHQACDEEDESCTVQREGTKDDNAKAHDPHGS